MITLPDEAYAHAFLDGWSVKGYQVSSKGLVLGDYFIL